VTDPVGTLAWAQATNGILRPRDRVAILRQAIAAQLEGVVGRSRRRLGVGADRLARVDLHELRLPDSALCREAERISEEATPRTIVNHAYRSYVWATILASRDRLDFDEELLYVACLLHDVGFVESEDPAGPRCFTLKGAEAALALPDAPGWSEERKRVAAEAITMHLNLRVSIDGGTEPYLTFAGSRLDAIGYRAWHLHPDTMEAVVSRYPRERMKDAFARTMNAQAAMSPGSRAHFYTRRLRGNRFVRRAPFAE
jgi:hypothetical protein